MFIVIALLYFTRPMISSKTISLNNGIVPFFVIFRTIARFYNTI